jgi:hypothetical protein
MRSTPTPPGGRAAMEQNPSIDDTETEVSEWTDSVAANFRALGGDIRSEAPYPYSACGLLHNTGVVAWTPTPLILMAS